jgi:hypothetical protein
MRSPTFSIYKPNSNSASYGLLFIGLSVTSRRGCRVLHFLSINQTLIWRRLEGDELRVCYDTETKFPAGLTWVKENNLSGIGSPG